MMRFIETFSFFKDKEMYSDKKCDFKKILGDFLTKIEIDSTLCNDILDIEQWEWRYIKDDGDLNPPSIVALSIDLEGELDNFGIKRIIFSIKDDKYTVNLGKSVSSDIFNKFKDSIVSFGYKITKIKDRNNDSYYSSWIEYKDN